MDILTERHARVKSTLCTNAVADRVYYPRDREELLKVIGISKDQDRNIHLKGGGATLFTADQ